MYQSNVGCGMDRGSTVQEKYLVAVWRPYRVPVIREARCQLTRGAAAGGNDKQPSSRPGRTGD